MCRYVGFEIPNRFAIGYGLDYGERYRGLPYVAALDESGLPDESAIQHPQQPLQNRHGSGAVLRGRAKPPWYHSDGMRRLSATRAGPADSIPWEN